MGSPLPPHSLIFENFEKSTAVPDMAPEPFTMRHAPGCTPAERGPHSFAVVEPGRAGIYE